MGARKQLLNNMRPDSPGAIAERIAHRAIAAQAHREMLALFAPLITADMGKALAWQAARIEELRKGAR